jgi:hypothetical protein
MSKPSAVVRMAQAMARETIANQTRARLSIAFDAALIAAHEVLQLGPGRAAAFAQAYGDAMEELAGLYVDDCVENKDKQLDYAKGTRDRIIREIVGEANFVPFDKSYGEAVMDELKRIRIIQGKEVQP